MSSPLHSKYERTMGPTVTIPSSNEVQGEETTNRASASSTLVVVNQRLTLAYFTARTNLTIGHITVSTFSTAAGATPTLCQMALYSVDNASTGLNLTLLTSTANDTTLFAASNTVYTRSFTTPVQVVPGTRYAAGILVVTGTTLPTYLASGPGVGGVSLVAPVMAAFVAGQSSLPSSISALTGGTSPFYANLAT